MLRPILSGATFFLGTSLAFAAAPSATQTGSLLSAPSAAPSPVAPLEQTAPVKCEPSGGFAAWRDGFKRYAITQGISARTASALDGLTPSKQVLSLDRNQKAFRISFDQWVRERVNPRIERARQK